MDNQSMKKLRFYKRFIAASVLLLFLLYNLVPTVLLKGIELVQAAESGTQSDPIQIDTVQELKEITNGLDKHYILAKDIELDSALNWTPIGTLGQPFTGSLDGNGHKIINLRIINPVDYLGLFGFISNAEIKNLTMI